MNNQEKSAILEKKVSILEKALTDIIEGPLLDDVNRDEGGLSWYPDLDYIKEVAYTAQKELKKLHLENK